MDEYITVYLSFQIEQLDIPAVAAQRSFLWIWCGNTEGLERGRLVGHVHMWQNGSASYWNLICNWCCYNRIPVFDHPKN